MAQSEQKPTPSTASTLSEATPEKEAPKAPLQVSEIAVIGMSGRFPDAENIRDFWKNLATGRCSVREIDRWDPDQFYDPKPGTPNRSYCKWGGHLNDIYRFDPLFFNLSPREAELMDPQHRLFLEETWSALEDAGYSGANLAGVKCSVHVGTTAGDYSICLDQQGLRREAYAFTGNAASILAARIAYFLNLKGPCIPVETACSSSLVAIHLACEGIRAGDTEMAIAGGVAVTNTPEFYIMASQAGMLSPQGKCRAFDSAADGFVPGEGVGVVILKRLDAALKDGDHIYGVISGSAINQDGKSNGITSPNGPSQTALECEVYDRFKINPEAIGYVEAHGTGTKLGDPIEMDALTKAFGKYTDRKRDCPIGSVKSNIGHALTASGMAGMIKLLLCLQYRKLVPTLHVQRENELIDFANSPFYVNTKLRPWHRKPGVPRLAVLSSFGFSGTNAHLAIREAPVGEERPDGKAGYLMCLSAKTPEALEQKWQDLLEWLERKGDRHGLRHMAFTLHLGRAHFSERAALVVTDREDFIQKLRTIQTGGKVPDLVLKAVETVAAGNLAKRRLGEAAMASLKAAETDREGYLAGLLELGRLYVAGADPDWQQLYEDEPCGRIPLPTYPFARERYPVPEMAAVEPQPISVEGAGRNLHPLVGENTSTLQKQSYSSVFSGDEFFLTDHVLHGNKVLPGAAYLEMVRAAADMAMGEPVTQIHNLVWMTPAVIKDQLPLEMVLDFIPQQSGLSFKVTGRSSDGSLLEHSEGQVSFEKAATPAEDQDLDLDTILGRCPDVMDGLACYEQYDRASVKYGPRFRVIQSLNFNENEIVASLGLKQNSQEEDRRFTLHPALLDGAIQSLIAFAGKGAQAMAYLPLAVEMVEILGECPSSCIAHITRKPESTARLGRFDILLADEAGRIRVKMKNVAMKAVTRELSESSDTEPSVAGEEKTRLLEFIVKSLESGTLTADEAERLMGEA